VELAGLETLPLFEDTFYLAVPLSSSVPLAEPVELADLKEEKFVTINNGFTTARCFSNTFTEAWFEPIVVTRLNDIFSLMNMAQAGATCHWFRTVSERYTTVQCVW
jgi:LysR family malonate utilization transcriptional regulator